MIQLKSFRKKRKKIAKNIMLTLIGLIGITVIVIIILSMQGINIKLEAGEELDLSEIFNDTNAEFDRSFDKDSLNHPGTYKCDVILTNKTKKIKITVVDTKAPEIQVYSKIYVPSVIKAPTPEDFVKEGYDPDSYTGYFDNDMDFEFSVGSAYALTVYYKDPSGNKTENFEVVASFINDKEAPKINIADNISFTTDDPVSYKSYITAIDNCIGDVTLEIDDSNVDYKTPGEYNATATAADVSGNTATKTFKVTVKEGKNYNTSLSKLNKKLSEVVPTFIQSDMTTEEKCRQVYTYVRKQITYANESISHDYIEVAYDALFVSGYGDCFAYFSAAKALLDYLGIENMDIERSDDGIEGTHFWNYVNIGTKSSPKWYHFDCTELTKDYNESGCLLTNAQVSAYDIWRYDALGTNFRQYDKSKYPKAATKIITETPSLKDYMD